MGMNKKIFLMLVLFVGLFISMTSVEAAPLLSNPYIIPTNANDEVGKIIPANLVDLNYIGKDIKNDVFLNDELVSNLNFNVRENDTVIIKNMGVYRQEMIDVNIKLALPANIKVATNGMLTITATNNGDYVEIIRINVYKHDTKTVYPNLYVGYSDGIINGWSDYAMRDFFGYDNLYGLYLPKVLGPLLKNVDLTQHDGVLDFGYVKGNNNQETVYPIFNNTETGFIRGRFFKATGYQATLRMFNPDLISPIPIPYEGAIALNNKQEVTKLAPLDVFYTVTQKLAKYVAPAQYPNDQTFKIKTNFELDPSRNAPIEVVVKLENNQVADKIYYSSGFVKNSYEVTFSSDFLKKYSGTTIKIEYKQHIDDENINLIDYYNMEEQSFIFPYSAENKWERQSESFKQEEPSVGQTKVTFPIELDAKLLNGKKVIQNKSTDDYDPLDFVSDLTSNLPGDSVSATFTKKVVFQHTGEQDIFITLKSSLSSVTKDIVLKVVVIEGTLHFTEVPSELTFPNIALTGKMIDYEVSSFNKGRLSVLDDRLTSSSWSLTATLTDNKSPNNVGDILYFRNEEGTVYNITTQTQNVMTNRNLEPTKTIIDYEQNKQTGLFIRVNPLFVKKGAYEGSVTWSLMDAPG